ncbi:hypothetical protein [Nocardioides sp. TF02-7]|nr:hypothetical protein [Nocardioides sp. TF02-7]UMG93203.1 hypothetical protein MF408_02550 [Nocardioides sp. TF02-7]
MHHRTAPARLQVVGHRILRGLHSDHRPLVTDFRVLGKGCYQNRTVVC